MIKLKRDFCEIYRLVVHNFVFLFYFIKHLHKYLVALPQRDRPHQAILPGNVSEHVTQEVSLNASEIRRLIDQQNSKQTVFNEDVYGPLQNDSLVIVIQVSAQLRYKQYKIILIFTCTAL